MTRRAFDRLAYRDPRPSPPIISAVGLLNRAVLLPHVLKLRGIDFPVEDLARLRAVVRPGTVAFLAPNHPEYMTDWLIDKEISRRVSPLMAHWASYEIVNIHPLAQWVWLRNNLIANAPGGSGREYSLRWARAGHGVLLHPEGTPTWHGDHIGPLVPGVIEMAWQACEGDWGPAYVVPIVWKLHFRGDVTAGLHSELAHLERGLGLPSGAGLALERRFAGLHKAILARSLARYGPEDGSGRIADAEQITDTEFFIRQRAHEEQLLQRLESRHGESDGDRPRRIHALRRAIHTLAKEDAEAARRDREMLFEIVRLGHFTGEHYPDPSLTQEQIAESLKQTRLALLRRGWREGLHGVLPIAVAPRIASIRVPEPISVSHPPAGNGDPAATQGVLLHLLRERMQEGLDRLNAELAACGARRSLPNPFYAP